MTTPYGPGDHPYPFQHQNYPPTHNPAPINPSKEQHHPARDITRTPSPSPSELEELTKDGVIDWKSFLNWRFWIRREWLWYYVVLVIILVAVALVALYDKQIVHFLEPTARKIHDIPAGWVIPIAILFIISFPPLFGHEIVAIICGLVWGLGVGFAIVAVGTYLGEVGNFYAFKYCCRARGDKLEKTSIQYACLARIVREGGFKVALVARFSAIPGHFTTAVFATCGMNIFVFSIAAILSLPKQFIVVYVGVILEQSGTGTANTKNKIIQDVVLVITFLVTGLAMWYIVRKMSAVKGEVIYARRKARQGKLARAGTHPYAHVGAAESGAVFDPGAEEASLEGAHQRWDAQGRAVGYAGDPRVYAPRARRVSTGPGPAFGAGAGAGAGVYAMREREGEGEGGAEGGAEGALVWEGAAQTYRLPEIEPHTPLTGGLGTARPAHAVPPQQPQPPYHERDPFASTESIDVQAIPLVQAPLPVEPHPAQQPPYSLQPPPPAWSNTHPPPHAPRTAAAAAAAPPLPSSPPAQYATAYAPAHDADGPPPDTPGALPSPQFHLGARARTPADAFFARAFSPPPPSYRSADL